MQETEKDKIIRRNTAYVRARAFQKFKYLLKIYLFNRDEKKLVNDPDYMSSTIKNYQFTIPIKPDTQVGLPQNFNNRIARQYASMYLEKIGAIPDDENIDTVLENHPLNKCGVSTSLKTRGWMEDLITINTSPFNRSMTEDDFPDKPDKKLYFNLYI